MAHYKMPAIRDGSRPDSVPEVLNMDDSRELSESHGSGHPRASNQDPPRRQCNFSDNERTPLLNGREQSSGADSVLDVSFEEKKACLPHRFRLFLIVMSGFAVHMTNRGNFNIAMVAMVGSSVQVEDSVNVDHCPGIVPYNETTIRIHGAFSWSSTEQSQLLAAYFYGYALLQLPAGYITERWGSRNVVTVAMGMAGILNMMTPLLARTSYGALVAGRALLGLAGAPIYVAMITIWSKWAPRSEVTFLVGGSMSGFIIGQILSFSTTGVLCSSDRMGGWPSVFYIYGVLNLVWVVFWVVFVSESPRIDPTISLEERVYIEQNTDNRDTKKYRNPPILKMLTSPAVLCILLMNATDGFAFYVIFNCGAIYLSKILGFGIQYNGLALGLQYAGCLVTSMIVPPVSDVLRARGIFSTTTVRKINSAIGDLGLALALILIAMVYPCTGMAVVVLLILGQFANAFQGGGFQINAIDIAPLYAGTITGLSNTMSQVMGFIAPQVVVLMTGDNPGVAEWKRVFLITSGILVFGVVVYSVCAKGEELPWAAAGRDEEEGDGDAEDIGPTPGTGINSNGTLINTFRYHNALS